MVPGADVRADLRGLVPFPVQQHLEDHQGLAVHVNSLPGERRLDLAADLVRSIPSVGTHRILPVDQMDAEPAVLVPVEAERLGSVPGRLHPIAVEPLDLRHHPIESLRVAVDRLTVAGDEVGNLDRRRLTGGGRA